MSFEPELQKKVEDWLAWDENPKTRKEIEELVEKKDAAALRPRMLGKLSFGTAGIRARMEAGFARLNDLTVIQVSHGFARYLNEQTKGRDSRGVAIGYDGRYNSKRFALLATNIFVRNGIKVYLFSDVVPTPVVSYATAALKCDAGLMITASHNPKEDNGYKAYWGNGAQILAPHDVEICRIAQQEPQPIRDYWELSDIEAHPLVQSADGTLEQYFRDEAQLCYNKEVNQKSPLKFTYSAFHGVGSKFARRILEEFGVPKENVVVVKEQDLADPTFPTVPFPNPEEGMKVLTLSIKTADENGSTIILANDPDADRLQMAEKQKDGSWRVLTGNEMGTLMSWWTWKNWRAKNPSADLSKVYMLNSAVSSQIVKTMADVEGFKNDVTLTGFKWMGNLADKLRSEGNEVILAWEESIGFMPGHTLDKDGVSSVGVFAEIANYLHSEGKLLTDQLFSIYNKYGFHLVRSSYWIVPDTSVTKQLFSDLRADLKYPQQIGDDAVKSIRDLTTGYDSAQPDNKAVLPISTSSEMVTFTLASGSVITLRASGTEPKIKYYIELKTAPGKQQSDLGDVLEQLSTLETNVVETLLQPKRYGLIPRA